jgi:hypothetical protein
MNEYIAVTLAIGSVLILTVLLLIILRKTTSLQKERTAFSIEEKALHELNKNRTRMAKQTGKVSRKQAYRFYKRLRIIFTVYMKEKYDQTIRDRIDDQTFQTLLQHYSSANSELNRLVEFFDAMERYKLKPEESMEIVQMYDSAIDLFNSANNAPKK